MWGPTVPDSVAISNLSTGKMLLISFQNKDCNIHTYRDAPFCQYQDPYVWSQLHCLHSHLAALTKQGGVRSHPVGYLYSGKEQSELLWKRQHWPAGGVDCLSQAAGHRALPHLCALRPCTAAPAAATACSMHRGGPGRGDRVGVSLLVILHCIRPTRSRWHKEMTCSTSKQCNACTDIAVWLYLLV